MPRIFPLFKKVAAAAAVGGAQFAGLQSVGVALSSLLTSKAEVSPAVGLSQRLDALVPVTPAVGLTTSVSGSSERSLGVAPSLSSVYASAGSPTQAPAAEIVQITYDLVGTYGAASATNVTVSGTAWASSGNAAGEPNGTLSTHPGNVASAQDAHLTFAFPALTGKTDLTITKVELLFWASQTGTTLNNGELRFLYGPSANSGEILLDNFADNQNFISSPKVRDITSDSRFTTWAGLADLRARVRHTAAVAETHVGNVDAVQLRVTATRTDSL